MATARPTAAPLLFADGPDLDAHLAKAHLCALYLVTSADPVDDRRRNEEPPTADPQALRAAVARIEAAALRGGDPALDQVRIDYLDGDHAGDGVHALIASEARSISLFGGRRVISVLHCEEFDFDAGGRKRKPSKKAAAAPGATEEAATDPLERLLQGLPPAREGLGRPPFVLILSATRFDRRKRAWAELQQRGVVVAVAPLDPAGLQAYVEEQARLFGIRVDRQVAQRIWDRLGGGESARLKQTADRLLLDAGPGGTLTVAQVEAVVPMDREAAVWAITDAVAEADAQRGLAVLHMLLEHEQEPIAICAALAANLRGLLRIADAIGQGRSSEAELAAETGMHPYRAKLVAQQVRRMKPQQLERALQTVADLDVQLRASLIPDRKIASARWLESAILALCAGLPMRVASTSGALQTL